MRENVTDIKDAQRVLNYEIHRYYYRQLHSTTQQVPYYRFQKAIKEGKSLFREFKITQPFKVNKATFREVVNLRIYPISNAIAEVRFWCRCSKAQK